MGAPSWRRLRWWWRDFSERRETLISAVRAVAVLLAVAVVAWLAWWQITYM